jgi:hypothetical protein
MKVDINNMSSEELNEHLMERLQQEYKLYRATTKTHLDYLDLTLHNSIANMNPDKVVTINGGKFLNEVTEEDHLVTLGDIMQIENN